MGLGPLPKNGTKVPPIVFYDFVIKRLHTALTRPTNCSGSNTEADVYAEAYLAHNLLRKKAPPKADSTLRDVAISGFLARERVNAKINRTETFGYCALTGSFATDTIESKVLALASDIIVACLGESPTVAELASNCSFGNGASATLCRREAQREKKYVANLSLTRELLPLALKVLEVSPVWLDQFEVNSVWSVSSSGTVSTLMENPFTIVSGSVFDTVPKDCKTDRVIMKEPEVNGYIQKAIGSVIRKKLRRFEFGSVIYGCDLNRSGDRNSSLARDGSIDGHIATIDAERASDSLTLALYERLFPREWYELLLKARSPMTSIEVNGENHLLKLDMMSGMGNGFTFEAESLIFYSIGLAATMLYSKLPFGEFVVSVHGDDLVVPSDVGEIVATSYAYAGIVVNTEKTFISGKFRESCGGHWYSGHSVKPFYQKHQRGDCRGDWFWLANSLLLWLKDRDPSYIVNKPYLKELLLYIRWYASSGKPQEWIASLTAGRRTGLYGTKAPELRGAFYYTKSVISYSAKEKLPEVGRYLAWLQQPTRLPTVHDLCLHRSASVDDSYALVETKEREGRIRFSEFVPA